MNQSSMNIRIQASSPSLLLPRAKVCSQGMCPCIRVKLETFFNSNLLKTSVVARCPLGWSKTPSVFAEPIRSGALVTSGSQETPTAALVGNEKIGVLLLNLGGPETLDDVQLFLFDLFSDPPLVQFISVVRSRKSTEGFASIDDGSPLRRIPDAQAEELRKALCDKNVPAKVREATGIHSQTKLLNRYAQSEFGLNLS